MFNFGFDYQRYSYFKTNVNNLPSDIIIKLTPSEIEYDYVKSTFDKRIVLIRENIQAQSESRVFSEIYGKKFSKYTIPDSFLLEYKDRINEMNSIILKENTELKLLKDCLHITYEELYQGGGINLLESYFDTKFKYILENKRYRNMNQNLV